MRCTNCPRPADGSRCLGERLTRVCRMPAYRGYLASHVDALSSAADRPPEPVTARLLAAVVACPDRGGVLPLSLQPDGCGCGELSLCRSGKGAIPGRVTLRDCLDCRRKSLSLG